MTKALTQVKSPLRWATFDRLSLLLVTIRDVLLTIAPFLLDQPENVPFGTEATGTVLMTLAELALVVGLLVQVTPPGGSAMLISGRLL